MAPKFKLALEVPPDNAGAAPSSSGQGGPDAGLCDSWKVNSSGTLTVLSKSYNPYQFSSQGLIKAAGGQSYKVSEQDIVTVKTLGRGASSTVYKGYHHTATPAKFVAVKKINIFDKEMRAQMMNDVKALCDAPCDAPGLIAFHGAYHVPDNGQICIVLEYMDGGSLADVLMKVGRIPEPQLAAITERVLQGLATLHRRKMVHRDIKPANILLNLLGQPKISDFGISATVDSTLAQCHTFTGTVTYMSPERIRNAPYSFPADIWSLGLVLVECVTGRYPFDANKGPLELMLQVMQEEVPVPEGISPELRDFVVHCLRKEPLHRPTAEALLRQPFVTKYSTMRVDLKAYMHGCMHDQEARLDDIAFAFSWNYYHHLSWGPEGCKHLDALYSSESLLHHEGECVVGRAAIASKLRALTELNASWGGASYRVKHVDCQRLGQADDVLVLVTGSIAMGAGVGGTSHFSESFVLCVTAAGEYFVARQSFRLTK